MWIYLINNHTNIITFLSSIAALAFVAMMAVFDLRPRYYLRIALFAGFIGLIFASSAMLIPNRETLCAYAAAEGITCDQHWRAKWTKH